jgi:uncharacterized membrane protein YkvA (DUF1232 family)
MMGWLPAGDRRCLTIARTWQGVLFLETYENNVSVKSGRIQTWRRKATQLKTEVYAFYFAVRDPRVPWYAKVFVGCVVAYALSPIDLIPDFIPVLGYLDDLVLLPLAIALTHKMIPPAVLVECREKARPAREKPKSWLGAIIIVSIWILLSAMVISVIAKHFS